LPLLDVYTCNYRINPIWRCNSLMPVTPLSEKHGIFPPTSEPAKKPLFKQPACWTKLLQSPENENRKGQGLQTAVRALQSERIT
jgi:hypothetical protein